MEGATTYIQNDKGEVTRKKVVRGGVGVEGGGAAAAAAIVALGTIHMASQVAVGE